MTKNIIPTINISPILKYGFDTSKSFKTINKIKQAQADLSLLERDWIDLEEKSFRE